MFFYIFRCSVYASYVFMITSNPIDSVFCLKFFQIFPEVSSDNRIYFSIEYIAGEENEVRIQIIYFPNYTLYIDRSVDWGEMNVAGDGYGYTFLYAVFFLEREFVSMNRRGASVDITNTEKYESRDECHPGCIVGYLLHARLVNPVCSYINEFKNIKTYADKEKMDHTNEPERAYSDEYVRKKRAPFLLSELTDDVCKAEKDKSDRKNDFIDPKCTRHTKSMYEYIGIECCVEREKNSEKEKEIGMTHDYFL